MPPMAKVLVYFLFNCFVLGCVGSEDFFSFHSGLEQADNFSNEWIVRVEGGKTVAQLLALETGCIYGGQLSNFPNTYIFIKDDHVIKRRAHSYVTRSLINNPKVEWAEQLFAKKRQKRDFQVLPEFKEVFSNFLTRNKSDLVYDELVPLIRKTREDLKVPKKDEVVFNDELWSQEWYLHDTRTRDDLPKLDLNVLPVYKMGITGKGIRVSILDDGIEYLHDDLKDNYDPEISYDCNEKDDDPTPAYDSTHRNAHGTRCAGEVAMTANNGKCGVGIAFKARIGGIKLLDGVINDRVEGAALGFGYDKIDIYSASWGPNDDGKTVEGPGRLTQEALERGVTKGRNGKGTIFVFANGNGGSRGDNCNCDGYVGSIYTVAIGSASQRGAFPWYGEPCAATLAVTYSSGAYQDQMITTTDLHNECTIKHTGTSASAPLAAGIIALALEANGNLTWRDVQHLISWTSEYMPLADNLGWQINGAGFKFDVRFGFGLMNAHALVMAAKNWTNVPDKSVCEIKAMENINVSIFYSMMYTTFIQSDGCLGKYNEVNFLEHMELKVNILYTLRGSLEIFITSPKGTRLPLLSHRRLDHSPRGFINWKFMSVGTWGEDPKGVWTIEVIDKIGPLGNRGKIGPLTLILHGTKKIPNYFRNGPRVYNTNYQLFEPSNPIHTDSGEPYPSIDTPIGIKKLVEPNDKEFIQSIDNSDVKSQSADLNAAKEERINKLFNAINILREPELNKFNDNPFESGYDYPDDFYDEDRVLNRVHHQNYRLNNDKYINYDRNLLYPGLKK